ncbi:MIP/aquaporin family protein [Candidatus Nitrosotenuis cloacae]|uniref:MIP/aquaporin family protein n=1 Tax=Candidatus Nitrosotenuis cloacae TaxID=1603555 RepID=UPI00228264A9|nr:MIP family channel protein [Candidatus Nitrosotenuis cloacae]
MVSGRSWFAESIATFCLVFFGPLSVVMAAAVFGTGLSIEGIIMISLGHGAAIGLMVYAFGHVSGAHINPAVTIAMLVTRRIGVKDAAGYIAFQIIGAIIAAFTLKAILPDLGAKVNYGTQGGPSELLGHSAMSGFALELVFTFFLVTVIFMTAVHKKAPAGMYGLAIGGMIFLLHLVGVPLTGASMNPARTLGPAIASGYWDFHWIYWAGPIIGAVIAGLIMHHIFAKKADAQ